MFYQCKSSILSAVFILALVYGFFVSGAFQEVLAEPPFKRDCTQQDPFERLECRQAALAEQLEYTADEVYADGTKLHQHTKPARLAHIKNSKKKAQRANKKNKKEFFKRHVKAEIQGNKKGGHLVPFDDVVDDTNSDGICDYEQGNENAYCAAIELDESGNLQICNPEKKNKGKGKVGGNPKFEGLECDLFFDPEEASTISEQEDMEEAAGQLEDTFSAMEDDLIEMNEHLDAVNAIPEESIALLAAESGCVLPEVDPALADAAFALREVHAALFGAARIAADWGSQAVVAFGFGGNARTVAVFTDAAALAANIAYITVDELHKEQSGELQSAIMNCVHQTAGDIAELKTQLYNLQVIIQKEHQEIINNDDANTDTILTNLEKVRAELVDLLNTPQGRRDAFPIK